MKFLESTMAATETRVKRACKDPLFILNISGVGLSYPAAGYYLKKKVKPVFNKNY